MEARQRRGESSVPDRRLGARGVAGLCPEKRLPTPAAGEFSDSPSMPPPSRRSCSLARTLGLSRTTVSDALRNSSRVDPATAARVKHAAREAGYRRNPLAGALMSELRRSRGTTFRGVLAAVDFLEPHRPSYAARYHRELVAGAEARAAELGFKVENSWSARPA
jgi:hypothetical protein